MFMNKVFEGKQIILRRELKGYYLVTSCMAFAK